MQRPSAPTLCWQNVSKPQCKCVCVCVSVCMWNPASRLFDVLSCQVPWTSTLTATGWFNGEQRTVGVKRRGVIEGKELILSSFSSRRALYAFSKQRRFMDHDRKNAYQSIPVYDVCISHLCVYAVHFSLKAHLAQLRICFPIQVRRLFVSWVGYSAVTKNMFTLRTIACLMLAILRY